MATVTINGQALYFTRPIKTAEGPVLLLIHGAGGNHLAWPREIQRLTGANVYNLDLPGHGRSTGPGRDSVEGYADVVQAFIEFMGLGEVTIAGHSMGGAIAQTLALRKPAPISKMIILNSGAKLRVAPQILHATLTEPKLAADMVVRMSWSLDTPNEVIRLGQQNMLQIDTAVLHGDFLACDCFDSRSELHQIAVPALIISSSDDRMTPVSYGRYLADHIDGARLLIIEGAGHFAMLEKPQEVAAAITEFLAVNDHLD